jgi:hypothetical protein
MFWRASYMKRGDGVRTAPYYERHFLSQYALSLSQFALSLSQYALSSLSYDKLIITFPNRALDST